MHKMPTVQAIRRLRVGAFLLLLKCLLAPVTAWVLIHSFAIYDRQLKLIGLGMLLLLVIVVMLQWLISNRANCPLCMSPVLADKKCMKHRSASSLLGSHRLRVAAALIFTGRFRCQYCGEPTQLVVRHPRRR